MTSEIHSAALAVFEYGLAANVSDALKLRTGEDQPRVELQVDPLLRERVLHLMRIDSWAQSGYHPRLSADELLGLELLRDARRQFDARHPGCPHCGAPLQKADDTLCWRCWRQKENADERG